MYMKRCECMMPENTLSSSLIFRALIWLKSCTSRYHGQNQSAQDPRIAPEAQLLTAYQLIPRSGNSLLTMLCHVCQPKHALKTAHLHEDEGVEDDRVRLGQVVVVVCLLLRLPLHRSAGPQPPGHGDAQHLALQ